MPTACLCQFICAQSQSTNRFKIKNEMKIYTMQIICWCTHDAKMNAQNKKKNDMKYRVFFAILRHCGWLFSCRNIVKRILFFFFVSWCQDKNDYGYIMYCNDVYSYSSCDISLGRALLLLVLILMLWIQFVSHW